MTDPDRHAEEDRPPLAPGGLVGRMGNDSLKSAWRRSREAQES